MFVHLLQIFNKKKCARSSDGRRAQCSSYKLARSRVRCAQEGAVTSGGAGGRRDVQEGHPGQGGGGLRGDQRELEIVFLHFISMFNVETTQLDSKLYIYILQGQIGLS